MEKKHFTVFMNTLSKIKAIVTCCNQCYSHYFCTISGIVLNLMLTKKVILRCLGVWVFFFFFFFSQPLFPPPPPPVRWMPSFWLHHFPLEFCVPYRCHSSCYELQGWATVLVAWWKSGVWICVCVSCPIFMKLASPDVTLRLTFKSHSIKINSGAETVEQIFT